MSLCKRQDFNAYHIDWLGSVPLMLEAGTLFVTYFAAGYDLTQLVGGLIWLPDIERHNPGVQALLLMSYLDSIRVSRHIRVGTSDHLLIRSEVSVTETKCPRVPTWVSRLGWFESVLRLLPVEATVLYSRFDITRLLSILIW